MLMHLQTLTGTPELGVGSTVGTGASATLSGTMEDYMEGGVKGMGGGSIGTTDVSGATTIIKGSTVGHVGLAADGHDMYLNFAGAWPDITAAGDVTATGSIWIKWRLL
jgi:hypothetical protein